jgi:hypothetical protein
MDLLEYPPKGIFTLLKCPANDGKRRHFVHRDERFGHLILRVTKAHGVLTRPSRTDNLPEIILAEQGIVTPYQEE